MRKALSMLLALFMLSTLCLTALADVPAAELALSEPPVAGEADDVGAEPSVPEASEQALANLAGASLAEGPQANASVPSKVTLGVGETFSVKVSGAKKYKSSNTKNATVSSKGLIKGVKKGSATITITMKKGDPLKVKVTVKKAPTSVKLNKKTIKLAAGETFQLKATLSSGSASKLTWKSDKKSVAKVDDDGLVTALKAGKATITVSTYIKDMKATCTVEVTQPSSGSKVGVSMPTRDLFRWKRDGGNLQKRLKKAGMKADLKFASNDPATQRSQIEAMIDGGCDVLIVAPIESSSLGSAMKKARDKGIPVIAYDRLIMDSDAVSYYVTFDNYQVGVVQGQFIESALNLKKEKGPFNIEFTTGDPGDNNAHYFYQGAMDVLGPYIKSGKLKVLSGQTKFEKVATEYWAPDIAEARARKILSSYYSGKTLHAWLCSNDSTAQGVVHALSAKYKGKIWPVVTGQDCDVENVKFIIDGKQTMSVFKNTDILVARAVKMAGQILLGEAVDVNDTETYDNNAHIVPAYLCAPDVVTVDNYKKVLIDSGIYPADWF